MAEEQLNLIDNMSPSLRRIYQEAERLNKRMLTLRSNIKALEKPASLSYMRRELRDVEKQAQQTERAIKAMKSAELNNSRYGAFTVGANGRYYLNGIQVRNDDRLAMAEAYNRNVQSRILRRNKLLWENGRTVNGLNFDERLMARRYGSWALTAKGSNLIDSFNNNLQQGTFGLQKFVSSLMTVGFTLGSLALVTSTVRGAFETLIEPTSKYMSNFMRTNLTSDSQITPRDMVRQLYDTAIRTRSDAEGTMMLYNRIAMSGVRATNEDIRRFVETFNKTMMISGTSGQENRAVMLQLAQGMGSNRLGGDEFRSIAEQAPMFKYMLAKGMNVNPGALKQMGAEGKLTADAIMKAMQNVQDLVDKIAQDAPLTIDQIFVIMRSKWEKFLTDSLSGYITLRNFLKQFLDWLDTSNGQKFMKDLVQGMNTFIIRVVTFMKSISRPMVWVLTHLKEIGKAIKWIFIIIAISKWQVILGGIIGLLTTMQAQLIALITNVGSLGYAFLNVGGLAKIGMGSAVTSIKAVGVALHTWVPELLVILALMLAITKLIPAIKTEMDTEKYIHAELKKQGFTNEDIGKASHYQVQQKGLMAPGEMPVQMTKGAWAALKESERLREQYKKDHPKEGTDEWYKLQEEKAMKQYQDLLKSTQGVMDSSKNVPMVGKVNEVGKINDDITLNTDSIQMLKAIAERSWIMQNEVTVPQKVDVSVSNVSELEPEKIAEMINEGSRIAIASSMRGVA